MHLYKFLFEFFAFILIMDLEKIVALGERLGLEGEKLQAFVQDRELKLFERDERAAAREAEKLKIENDKLRIEADNKAKDQDMQMQLLAREIELEKVKSETKAAEGLNASLSNHGPSYAKLPKLPPFDDKSDCIDAYLQRYERFASNAKWDKGIWSINLSALLKGKALEVYSRLSSVDAMNYDALKEELLKRFQLTEEGFHTKFRTSKPEKGESPPQFVARLNNYLDRWMSLANAPMTFEGLKDLLLREQFIASSSKTLSIFLKERHPKDVNEMTLWAEQFVEAHGTSSFTSDKHSTQVLRPGNLSSSSSSQGRGMYDLPSRKEDRKCYECGHFGHIARDCLEKQNKGRGSKQHAAGLVQEDHVQSRGRGRGSGFGRGAHPKGQGQSKADSRVEGKGAAQYGSACILTDKLQNCCVQDNQVRLACGHALPIIGGSCKICDSMPVIQGYVGSVPVTVLRDSGCGGVVVKRSLVSEDQFTETIRPCVLIDGTVREFPEARIYVDTPFYTGTIHALCMENPVYDLIIGNIKGAREPSNPDPNWKSQVECETYCIQEEAETTEKVSVIDNSSVSCIQLVVIRTAVMYYKQYRLEVSYNGRRLVLKV